jgi:hypothetical protein
MSRCQNCGHENDMDAAFCESCGEELKTTISNRKYPKEVITKDNGMSQSTKILIAVCIILVAGLGITAGALMQMNKGGVAVVNSSSVTESPTQITNQATWHEITSFTGTTDDMRTFTTQGNRFKIVMSATPQQNYNTNSMLVDVSNSNNNLITSGNIAWTSTEAVTQKEKSIEITSNPGTYSMTISTNSLTSWTVNVYDYY